MGRPSPTGLTTERKRGHDKRPHKGNRERAESAGKKDTLDPCARRVGLLTESKHRTAPAAAAAAAAAAC